MVTEATYEPTDPTIDSQITTLQASGADVLVVAAAPKFAAQSIRKVHDLGWKPMFFMTNVSISVGSVITPAGPENAIGLISTGYLKDPTDHQWDNDAGMKEWRDFMAKNMPGADMTDDNYVYAYAASKLMLQVLKQCNGDFSRENVMKQAENLHDAGAADGAAGDQGEHQPHRSPADQGDAAGEVGRQDLGAVRRHHRGDRFLSLRARC